MFVSEISLWGAAIVACVVLVAAIALAFFDRQMLRRMLEDMLHQVRNLAQPLVMVVPMLYAGMLLGGVAALEGLLVTLLLVAASFVANILAGVITLGMIRNYPNRP
jgi:hypothetical protein